MEKNSDVEDSKNLSPQKRSRSRSSDRGRINRRRRSRTRSRSRNRRHGRTPLSRSRSRSISPYRGRGGFRGSRNNRFQRRSPAFRGGRNFRDRFRRSRSTSRGRFERHDRRRFNDSRRSRSESPQQNRMDNNNYNQQLSQQQMGGYSNDGYGNVAYMPNAPQAPQFPGAMNQFNSYEFQGFPPPAPNFNMNINCPAPPGMNESWAPQPSMQMEEMEKEEKLKREAAIAEEKKLQREELKKQRDQYVSRSEKMKRELKVLKQQKTDLLDGLGKRSPSPKTNGFIKENDKLQSEISSKLTEILDAIDVFNGIIRKDDSDDESKRKSSKNPRKSDTDDSSPERIKSELLESMKKKKEAEEKKQKFNYIIYDPELHWCKNCQVFPKTAKDYLSHLHTKEHLEKIANKATEAPWRTSFQKTNEIPSYPEAPTKKAPIKGLQFFEPATAWFCKLCEIFMGDSWCVSLHLKSEMHSEKYGKLMEKEPKFEEKWLEARKKALELSNNAPKLKSEATNSDKQNEKSGVDASNKKSTDKKAKKKKNKKDSKKKRKHGKKRKRDSSSSSSDSDDNSDSSSQSNSSSKKNDSDHNNEAKNSIRVTMRNLLNKGVPTESDERSGKWTVIPIDSNKPQIPPAPTISQHGARENKKDEVIIGQWSQVEPIISQEEKRLLESLKGRLKTHQKSEDKESEKPSVPAKRSENDKPRSRSRERNRVDRNYRGRRSRSRDRSPLPRRRSRSRSRGRYGRRRYSRSRSRSRSRSPRNMRNRFEKQTVVFPTEPLLPPLKDEKKLPARSYGTTKKKEETSSSLTTTNSLNAARKMPFIGKMPVFKRQLIEKKNEDIPEEKKEEVLTGKEKFTRDNKKDDHTWDDLMPDPLQFSAIMNSSNAPPPPQQMTEVSDAPPGLDPELDSEYIPQPISDAPMPRKGPLPKDFQATLDLLYDGDKPKPFVVEPPVQEVVQHQEPIPNPNDGPQMILPEELSQHAILYGNFYQQTSEIQPVPPPPISSDTQAFDLTAKNKTDDDDKNENDVEMMEDSDDKFNKNQEDMDDLAMLGIDVNDVGSGLW